MSKTIQEKVAAKLAEQSGISGKDIAELMSDEPSVREEPVKEEEPEGPSDMVLEASNGNQPHDELSAHQESNEEEANGPFDTEMLEDVEVAEADKERFLDCLVDGKRFTKEYNLFNNRLRVTFRTRTTEETAALLGELTRKARAMDDLTSVEYSANLRHATMVFQVAELDDVEMPVPSGPLKATFSDKLARVEPPEWWKRLEFYATMSEGKEQAIYNALLSFEKTYWTMVRKAQDQNFWNPEDSTSA